MSTFSDYNGFMQAMYRLIDGSDSGVSDLPLSIVQQSINLAERRVYREVRSRHNEKALSGTVTSNLFTLPSDFEALSVIHFGGKPLEPVSEEWLRAYLDSGPTGDCRYVAEAGGSLMFGPSVTDGTSVQGRYFYRYADLTSANYAANTLIAKEPDVLMYATLVEAAPFLEQDQRALLWEAKYTAIRDRLNRDKQYAAGSAGRIVVRPSTRLMG